MISICAWFESFRLFNLVNTGAQDPLSVPKFSVSIIILYSKFYHFYKILRVWRTCKKNWKTISAFVMVYLSLCCYASGIFWKQNIYNNNTLIFYATAFVKDQRIKEISKSRLKADCATDPCCLCCAPVKEGEKMMKNKVHQKIKMNATSWLHK